MLHFMGVLLKVREKKEFLTGGEGIQNTKKKSLTQQREEVSCGNTIQ